jgi:protein-tyrosine phosphatase
VIALAESPEQIAKVQLILNELFPSENVDVPDPYFGLPNGFNIIYEMLDDVCDIISKKLIDKHQ